MRLNPFITNSRIETLIADTFTTKLPRTAFQQFARLTSHDIAKSRGNLGLAKLDLKPHNMTKAQFLVFASLRSYPQRQIRTILGALREKQLCLDDDNVRKLVLQSLFQVGDIKSTKGEPEFSWKRDATKGTLIPDLTKELDEYLDILANAPKFGNKFLLVIELCGYVADFFGEVGNVLLDKCVEVACAWSKCIEPPPSSLLDDVATLRSRQCLFTAYAVAAHRSYSVLTTARAQKLIQLNVDLKKLMVWRDPKDSRVTDLCGVAEAVMQHHFSVLKKEANAHPNILSEGVKSVVSDAPELTSWHAFDTDSGCYKATNGDTFCINILTGIVLRNGNPPHQLVCCLPVP